MGFYREYYRDKGIFENRVYEGMEETLKELKNRGKRLIVATSKPEPFARRIIDHFGLAPYFEYVAGMELDGGRGTKAEVIAYALSACGIEDRSGAVMVGDREHDVAGARKGRPALYRRFVWIWQQGRTGESRRGTDHIQAGRIV